MGKSKVVAVAAAPQPVVEKIARKHHRPTRTIHRGPLHNSLKRWSDATYGKKHRMNGEAFSIAEGVLDHLQARFAADAAATMSTAKGRRTYSRKDARYTIIKLLGLNRAALAKSVLDREEQAVTAFSKEK